MTTTADQEQLHAERVILSAFLADAVRAFEATGYGAQVTPHNFVGPGHRQIAEVMFAYCRRQEGREICRAVVRDEIRDAVAETSALTPILCALELLDPNQANGCLLQLEDYVEVISGRGTATDATAEVVWEEPVVEVKPEPVFDRAALYGIAGEYVSLVEPVTEAHPAGILAHFLAHFGAAVGRGPTLFINATEHHARVWPCLVGQTALARKGTASDLASLPFTGVDLDLKTQSGLSSGEGLIYAVRGSDEEEAQATVDPLRRRLLVEEPEFANVLAQTFRNGNTLSAKMRAAWDGKRLSTMTKTAVAVDGAHIVVAAHITREELRRTLNQTELANGFANRFAFVFVKRTCLLPRPPAVPKHKIVAISERLRDLIVAGRQPRRIDRSPAADEVWDEVYPVLSADRAGIMAQVTTRGAAQVLRLALIYCLLDGADRIEPDHLRAAVALWRYSAATCEWIWVEMTGDPIADRILAALRQQGEMLRSEITDLFHRHQKAERIQHALDLLLGGKLVRRGERRTPGRTGEVWSAR